MKKSVTNLRLLTGFGMAAALFLGCQDFLGEKDGGAPAAENEADGIALRLSVRNDSSCLEQLRILREGNAGPGLDSAGLQNFLSSCIEEKKPGPRGAIPAIPPGLIPDSGIRCNWIASAVRDGRHELIPALKKHCPDECQKPEVGDSLADTNLCRHYHPKPPARKDSLHTHPPKDSLHTHPPKDSLHVHPPKDSLPPPVPPRDTLHVHVPKDSVAVPSPVPANLPNGK